MGLIAWFKEKMGRNIFNLVFKNISFPNGCKSGNELDWMLKDNCPCCLSEPIETLSNKEYHKKYPANNRIQIGKIAIYLCDDHLKELKSELLKDEHI